MQLKVFVNSATDLKNVNWRHGDLQPYAVAWIDSGSKCSTKIDIISGVNPVWNEKFTMPLLPTTNPETAILYIDIVHGKPGLGTKPLIGSAKLPVRVAANEARAKGKAPFSLILERPSGRPQGSLEIQIEIRAESNISQREPYQQQAPYMPPQPQPQPQYQPNYQMNQYPNTPASMRPVYYPAYSPQNLRPNMRPQYRLVNPQPSVAETLCAVALGVKPSHVGQMMRFTKRIGVAAMHGAHHNANMNANINGTYGGDPSAIPGYDNAIPASDNFGCDNGGSGDVQFGTDGGFGNGGLDLGGFGNGGLDLSAFGNGGLDLSVFGNGGLDLGGLDLGGLLSN